MPHTRRTFLQLLGLGGASALTGCDAATDALYGLLDPKPGADWQPPALGEIDLASHVLSRIAYGARPGDYQRVKALGVDAFIEQQLNHQTIRDVRSDWKVAPIESLAQPTGELYEYDAGRLLSDLTRYKLMRGATSERQLFEVMVDFWTDHFNIVSQKGDCKWLKAADDRHVIRRHALGSFGDLVRASALSPAMLIYLDGHDNKVEQPGDRPNENYARELLELHTLGVHGGYTQRDVMEVARCLSGWTYQHKPFRFRAARVAFDLKRHDQGRKEVLGHGIPAGAGAEDLQRVLDIVCVHASTARHLATKLCRWFVADPPPENAVTATADGFLASGGDIRATLRSLFATDAFRTTRGNLFKRPLRFIISALRATGAQSDCGEPLIAYLHAMGHAPFQYPTPDGYPIDMQPWLGTLLWRWKFGAAIQNNRIQGTTLDNNEMIERFGDTQKLAAHLMGRKPNDTERKVLDETESPLALLLAGPAFQRF